MYAGTINYLLGSRYIVPSFSVRLFLLLWLREGSGVPAVAGNSSRPASYNWDNIGDSPRPRGKEVCAGVVYSWLGLHRNFPDLQNDLFFASAGLQVFASARLRVC